MFSAEMIKLLIIKFCTIDLGKANIVADALSQKSMKSLFYISKQKREIIKELQKLYGTKISFKVSEDQSLIAQLQVKSNLIDKIKATHDNDSYLVKLKQEVQEEQSVRYNIMDRVLKLDNRLCVPDVDELR